MTVRVHEVFVDEVVESAQLPSHPLCSLRFCIRLVANDFCATSATFLLYGFDILRFELCLSLALATVAAPVCEDRESRLETVAGEVQRCFLRFGL